jgi:SAM-dependent methyltransferase
MTEDGYLLDNRSVWAGERFEAMAVLFDPATFRHLDRLGLGPGRRCWEVGAGGTSVVRGLADRVGPQGRVLATDIDVSWAGDGAGPPVEVRRHDVVADPPPGEFFDLVHARLLLVHLVDRERVLATMVGTLRPGGWLLVEDADPGLQPLACPEARTGEEVLANRIRTGFRSVMAGRGVDLAYGRKLPRLLREAGLTGVGAEAGFPVADPACHRLEAATVRLIRDQLLAHEVATDEEIDRHLAAVEAGRLELTQPPMVSAWGQRPG